MSLRVCAVAGCPALIPQGQGRCTDHAREADKARGTSAQRGYGRQHKALRADLEPKATGTLCHFCGLPMLPGQALALDHTEDRAGYRGMTHADYRDCPAGGNAADGGRRSHT